MLKNSLLQPSLSFSFSTAPFFLFLLQRPFFFSSFLVSAPSLFYSALFLSFLFQHFFSFVSLFQRHFLLSSVSVPHSFVFCFSLPLFSVQHHFSCFFRRVALFFQPKTILSSAQKHFFQSKTFLLQPKTFFSSAHTTVSAFFSFCWFCFQRTFSFCSVPPFLLSFSAPHFLFLANFQGQKYSL